MLHALLLVKQNELCQQNSKLTEVAEGSFPVVGYGSLIFCSFWTSALQEYTEQQEVGLREGSSFWNTETFCQTETLLFHRWFVIWKVCRTTAVVKGESYGGCFLKGIGSSELMDIAGKIPAWSWSLARGLYRTAKDGEGLSWRKDLSVLVNLIYLVSLRLSHHSWKESDMNFLGGYISEIFLGDEGCEPCPLLLPSVAHLGECEFYHLLCSPHGKKATGCWRVKGKVETHGRWVAVFPLHKALLLLSSPQSCSLSCFYDEVLGKTGWVKELGSLSGDVAQADKKIPFMLSRDVS